MPVEPTAPRPAAATDPFRPPASPDAGSVAHPPWAVPPAPAAPAATVPRGRSPWWQPQRRPPSLGVVGGSLAVGTLAAVLAGPGPLGLGAPLVAAAACWSTLRLLRHRLAPSDRALLCLAVGLATVAAVRDSGWLVALALAAGIGLLCLVVTGARQWPAALLAAPLTALAALRAVGWTLPAAAGWSSERAARIRGGAGPWLRGAGLGVVLAWLVGALLASADAAFSNLISAVGGSVDLSTAPARLLAGGAVTLSVLGIAYGRTATPDWSRVRVPRGSRTLVEWAVPLALVDAVLALFVALQAAMLFGGAEVLVGSSLTYAQRAREGFGQLVAVSLLTAALLAWSARHCAGSPGRGRRVLGGLGGTLVVLTLVVVGSALRRMWLYEQAYGWTVLRLVVAAFEGWLAVTLVLVAGAWLLRRTGGVVRGVLAGAGAGLLALALVGPDAVVARLDVQRFADTGRVDVAYLGTLSADAVPELDRLPEPLRSCVLSGRPLSGRTWYSANLARWQADAILTARPPGAATCPAR